jgi:hypothetical protein
MAKPHVVHLQSEVSSALVILDVHDAQRFMSCVPTSFVVFFLKNLEVLENLILEVFDLIYVLMSSVFIKHIDNAF